MTSVISIDDIMRAASQYSSDASVAANEQAAAQSRAAALRTSSSTLLQGSASELQAAAAKELETSAALEQEYKKSKDAIDFDNLLVDGVAKYNAAYERARALNATIQQKESVGLLDNPLDWIVNQLSLDSDYAALKGATESMDIERTRLSDLHSAVDTHMNTALKGAKAQEIALHALDMKGRAAELGVAANNQLIEGQMAGVNALTYLRDASKQQLDALMVARSAQEQEENQALRREQIATARAQREALYAQKQDEKGYEQEFMTILNAGLANMQLPKLASYQQYKLADAKTRASLDRAYSIGYQAHVNAQSGNPLASISIGENAGDVALYLASVRGKLPPAQQKLEVLLKDKATGVLQGTIPVAPTVDRTKPEQAKGAISLEVERAWNAMQADVGADPERNIAAPAPLAVLVSKNKPLAAHPVTAKLFRADVEAGTALKAQEVVRRVAAATMSADPAVRIGMKEAVEFLSTYGTVARDNVNSDNDFAGKGLKSLKEYKLKYDTNPGGWNGVKTYRLNSSVDVTELLLRERTTRFGIPGMTFGTAPGTPAAFTK